MDCEFQMFLIVTRLVYIKKVCNKSGKSETTSFESIGFSTASSTD